MTGALPGPQRRLLGVAVLISAFSLLGFLLCLATQWPSTFTLEGTPDGSVTLADVVTGTPASIPLTPWLVLLVATAIAVSRRWWGAVGVVVLVLLGGVFLIGGWGEAFGPANPWVPHTALLLFGLVWATLGVALSVSAVLELVNRVRLRRSAAAVAE